MTLKEIAVGVLAPLACAVYIAGSAALPSFGNAGRDYTALDPVHQAVLDGSLDKGAFSEAMDEKRSIQKADAEALGHSRAIGVEGVVKGLILPRNKE